MTATLRRCELRKTRHRLLATAQPTHNAPKMVNTSPHQSEAGFVMVEVLACLAIAILVLATVVPMLAGGLSRIATAQEAAAAMAQAKLILARAGTEYPIVEGTTQGNAPRPWQIRVEPIGPSIALPDGLVRPFRLRVEVFQKGAGAARSVQLSSYRLLEVGGQP
jgi:type II secretory pathway pseudopilin PulG